MAIDTRAKRESALQSGELSGMLHPDNDLANAADRRAMLADYAGMVLSGTPPETIRAAGRAVQPRAYGRQH